MADGNIANFALTSLKNVYILTTLITSNYGKEKLQWHFLVRKIDSDYCDLFTNKRIYILKDSSIVLGMLGEYSKHCNVHFEKLTQINEFSNRFKGMDLESFSALSEFVIYLNIMSNMVDITNPQVVFEV